MNTLYPRSPLGAAQLAPSAGPRLDRAPARCEEPAAPADLVVVSCRLPVALAGVEDGVPRWLPAPGGVASALGAALRSRSCAWVGAAGQPGSPDGLPTRHGATSLHCVELSAEELAGYYERFCNAGLWPVLHGGGPAVRLDSEDWAAYRRVNERFAHAVADAARPGALVWVHDYQLMLVPRLVRALRPDLRIGFFLHTPMPQGKAFTRMPRSAELVEGVLGADLVGFQRQRDVFRFTAHAGLTRPVTIGSEPRIGVGDRQVACAPHPISVDVKQLVATAELPRVQARAREIRSALGVDRLIVLGVDRLDYTKGIPTRLDAFAQLVEDGTLGPDEVVFVQVAAPSRTGVTGYDEARRAVERAVAGAQAAGPPGHRARVVYRHTSLSHEELLAHYLAADVLCVTPLQDGMNLIAKEFVAVCRPDAGLVLSAEAGAAEELASAWTVDPYDVNDVKRGLFEALRAGRAERAARIQVMRHRLWQHDVHAWAGGFLDMLRAQDV